MSELFPNYRAPWESDDQAALRVHAAAFVAKEVTPHEERWAQQHQVDRDVWNKAGAAGLLCLDVPEEFGGAGGNFGHESVVQQELVGAGDSAMGFAVHSTIVAHYINSYATAEQRKRWLPRCATGEAVLAIAMTEPGTGSDLQAVRTTAVRQGDDYLINGSKTFISNATHCDLLIIVAKTDPSQGAKGISLFVAETKDLDGFERGRILDKIGQHGQDTRELAFTDMRVPAANLLGGVEGQGFYQLMNQLQRERLIIAVGAIAAAETAVARTIAYAKERKAFGKPLMQFQNTRFVLSECKADVLAGKTLIDHCIGEQIAGRLDPATASMAKLWATEKQKEVIDRCLQLFGGYGYILEYPIARMYADARVQTIYGGTSEIMKELIGRSL
ncbi:MULTISPECIES: acyl-CoA dehydrogenase family protein [Mycobacteriales]|jgi:acyl-CoA dehydrogenase|uniref:Acyl-[acyl-carrier-protein] dehydrogenase MbtN n=4 Tax=Mycobacteriales TaxID=85007 RepID=A0A846WWM2_9ACTN|nr:MULTISPECIES: acyl-CoA dehydrogenase family protein [Mycobacteriales]NKY05296.1 acyl-CoA dehydrogenase [Gordonia polyisoprenivorans]NKY20832.1 acyl-CoA dehydrogenase [Tsukamurella spumae]NMD58441.1 acyl-CoA dehydrogenase [Tsukamurella columbiensis]QUD82680.1 acyl-CoA dehydrogenase family protein [Gordonia polyisoprenivorans]TWS24617.1 acyl-CoA dehydrogenase [Tsukamurella conjunctivitidis]